MGDLREKRRRGKKNTHKGLSFEYPSMTKTREDNKYLVYK